jgi:tripartite-type tricarboxylate transporter receptor subunit TctC
LAARLLAERLTARWGQPVVVENRQGADGIPAVTAFLGARDNHTFLLSFAGVITFNHLLHERLPYDPATDLVPIVPVVDNFLGVSATALLQVNSVSELVRAAARSRASSTGRRRRGCPTTSCSPCRRAPASSWFRCPTATSRRPTRISIKDGCT